MVKPIYKIGDVVVYNNVQRVINSAFFDTHSSMWKYDTHEERYYIRECDINYKL